MQDDERAKARAEEFAEALLALKERTPHSYETLAARLGISRSALHRYCSGGSVPADFEVVQLLARQARAGRAELTELHRLWVLASEPDSPAPEPNPAAAVIPSTTSFENKSTLSPTPPADHGETHELQESDEAPGEKKADEKKPPAVAAAPTASRRWQWAAVALLCVSALVFGAVLMWNGRGGEKSEEVADNRPLFSGECEEPVRDGQSDNCVRELQRLLAATGVTIGIDGIFGPETLRRVEAFQSRVGLNVDGIVGDDTKRALYDGNVSLRTWSKERVAARIRQVFEEKPDTALRIALCQSFLDPLHITPNTNGTRNWGVFQISDARLRDLRGTPEKAMNPEWNIRAAHQLWAQDADFSDWAHCAAAAEDLPKEYREKGSDAT
ncbi:peptidoglycan-binding protein [Streptomyces sp. NPDC002793]|uniref:peptidoglycan-binding protein n=1 Tax=Streptomyces sp. NPDC002793 TaxID=3154432 RepID=UPI0033285296